MDAARACTVAVDFSPGSQIQNDPVDRVVVAWTALFESGAKVPSTTTC